MNLRKVITRGLACLGFAVLLFLLPMMISDAKAGGYTQEQLAAAINEKSITDGKLSVEMVVPSTETYEVDQNVLKIILSNLGGDAADTVEEIKFDISGAEKVVFNKPFENGGFTQLKKISIIPDSSYNYDITLGEGFLTGVADKVTELTVKHDSTDYKGRIIISANALMNATALQKATFGHINTIGASAFEGCTALTDVEFEGLYSLSEKAFYNCTSLRSFRGETKNSWGTTQSYEGITGELAFAADTGTLPIEDISTLFAYSTFIKKNIFGTDSSDKPLVPKTLKKISFDLSAGTGGMENFRKLFPEETIPDEFLKQLDVTLVGCNEISTEASSEEILKLCSRAKNIVFPSNDGGMTKFVEYLGKHTTGSSEDIENISSKLIVKDQYDYCSKNGHSFVDGKCTYCGRCENVEKSGSHIYVYVNNGNGTHSQKCDCGKVMPSASGPEVCTSAAITWKSNSTAHWHECDYCQGQYDRASHVDADSNYRCDVCDYSLLRPYIPSYNPPADPNPIEEEKEEEKTEEKTEVKKTPVQKVKVGDKKVLGGNTYKVTGSKKSAKTVAISAFAADIEEVRIPSKVKIGGEFYAVTEISKNTFKNNDTIKSVKTGTSIIKIGKAAFKGCDALESVNLGKNVDTIGANAFSGCGNLTCVNIFSRKLTGESFGKNAFKGISKDCVFFAPKGYVKKYRAMFKELGYSFTVKMMQK